MSVTRELTIVGVVLFIAAGLLVRRSNYDHKMGVLGSFFTI